MSALRKLLADGLWHRSVDVAPLIALHNEAGVAAGVMPLHVEIEGDRVRLAPKSYCSFCAEVRAEVEQLRARVERLEGRGQ